MSGFSIAEELKNLWISSMTMKNRSLQSISQAFHGKSISLCSTGVCTDTFSTRKLNLLSLIKTTSCLSISKSLLILMISIGHFLLASLSSLGHMMNISLFFSILLLCKKLYRKLLKNDQRNKGLQLQSLTQFKQKLMQSLKK